jgi:hypothetical protein
MLKDILLQDTSDILLDYEEIEIPEEQLIGYGEVYYHEQSNTVTIKHQDIKKG